MVISRITKNNKLLKNMHRTQGLLYKMVEISKKKGHTAIMQRVKYTFGSFSQCDYFKGRAYLASQII